ncbi:MAG: hypothetical protein WC495_06580 [Patescibacteria group bacterium]|jgi:hypothetical protein
MLAKQDIECELVPDGEQYFIGDFVKLAGENKVAHVPIEGRKFEDIKLGNDVGVITGLFEDCVDRAMVCFGFWQKQVVIEQ